MQVIRTIVWVLLLVAFLLFSFANWDQQVAVRIWDNLIWETKLPAVVMVAFLIGLVPMWLLHWATKWTLRRRIGSLESAARAAAMTLNDTVPPAAPPQPQPPPPEVPPADRKPEEPNPLTP